MASTLLQPKLFLRRKPRKVEEEFMDPALAPGLNPAWGETLVDTTLPPRRILVSKLGHIGDVLVATPFFKVLKQLFPQARLTVLVYRGTEEMAYGCPWVDQVLVVENKPAGLWQSIRNNFRLIKDLRSQPVDISFELSAADRGTYMCFLSGAKLRVGYASFDNNARDRLLHIRIKREDVGAHEVENFLRQLKIFGKHFSMPPLQWSPPASAMARADEITRQYGLDKFILIHPTSRWMFKAWSPAKNAVIINQLDAEGIRVVMTASPDREEMEFIEQINQGLNPGNRVVNLAGQLTLFTLGALIGRAAVFFGVDTAPMHMAAAMQTPTVALFGPSGEHMWGPWQVENIVLSGDCPIRPCGRDGCEGRRLCKDLLAITTDRVYEAIQSLWSKV